MAVLRRSPAARSTRVPHLPIEHFGLGATLRTGNSGRSVTKKLVYSTLTESLRNVHGGLDAEQEFCRRAAGRSPNIAGYGYRLILRRLLGTKNHRYGLAAWLRKNQGYGSIMEKEIGFQIEDLSFPLSFTRSDCTLAACPSEPRNMAWMERAVGWLAETFEIGGINIESGDYGVCGCDRCIARRCERESLAPRRAGSSESWSHADRLAAHLQSQESNTYLKAATIQLQSQWKRYPRRQPREDDRWSVRLQAQQ
jgi:hypothetical protein